MTLDEFLDDYTPRVLRPLGGWAVFDGRYIRRRCPEESCPITASFGLSPAAVNQAARTLDMDSLTRATIVTAADYREAGLPEVRARLLAGLGLSEPR